MHMLGDVADVMWELARFSREALYVWVSTSPGYTNHSKNDAISTVHAVSRTCSRISFLSAAKPNFFRTFRGAFTCHLNRQSVHCLHRSEDRKEIFKANVRDMSRYFS